MCLLINMHISNDVPIYLTVPVANFQIFDIYLKRKNMQVLCQHFHYVNAVEQKTTKVCVTP